MILPPDMTAAWTLWGEARGEPVHGIVAVACVIYNRAYRDAFVSHDEHLNMEERIPKICLAHKQFSFWVDGEFTQQQPDPNSFKWHVCQEIGRELLHGFVPMFNATHYYARAMPVKPYWADDLEFVDCIHGHVFMYDKALSIGGERFATISHHSLASPLPVVV